MNLDDALTQIAHQCGLDAAKLISFAAEDEIGGYHPDPAQRQWPIGSIFAVEGKFLYALVRALKPALCVEFGTHKGCSANHIAAALHKNDKGRLICIDMYPPSLDVISESYRSRVEINGGTHRDWLAKNTLAKADFVFDDMIHEHTEVADIWAAFTDQAPQGAMIVEHDALHFLVGAEVRRGIESVVGSSWYGYLIEPSDCGLGCFRKAVIEATVFDAEMALSNQEIVELRNGHILKVSDNETKVIRKHAPDKITTKSKTKRTVKEKAN